MWGLRSFRRSDCYAHRIFSYAHFWWQVTNYHCWCPAWTGKVTVLSGSVFGRFGRLFLDNSTQIIFHKSFNLNRLRNCEIFLFSVGSGSVGSVLGRLLTISLLQ